MEKATKSTDVNIAILEPVNLMKIPIILNGNKVTALLDSGATNSLVKAKLINTCVETLSSPKYILGLGNNKLTVEGISKQKLTCAGIAFEVDLFIIDSRKLDYDVVLGMDFLKKIELVSI